jgi:hypothetical protein
MCQREHDRTLPPWTRDRGASPRRDAHPVLALQRTIGNRRTAQVLARKGAGAKRKNEGDFEHSVTVGKLGPLEVKDSNIADWTGRKADAEDLVITSAKGKHSDELRRLSGSQTRVETIRVQSIVGENTFVIVTFKNAVITGYTADPGEDVEHWKAIRFDAVDIKRTSIGAARP